MPYLQHCCAQGKRSRDNPPLRLMHHDDAQFDRSIGSNKRVGACVSPSSLSRSQSWAQQATAADAPFPVLRGTQAYEIAPPPVFRWEGVYGGVQVGGNSAHVNFEDATKSIVGFALRQSTLEAEHRISEWPVLSGEHTRSASFGGFMGYNTQFENVVLGIEGNYNHTAFSTSQADSLTRVVTTAVPHASPPRRS
jgi:opacity protein-like surface antigen